MRIIDQNINRVRNKSQKQYEQSMWEKHAFIYVGIILSVEEKSATVKLIPSISYDDYDMKRGFTKVDTINQKVSCYRVEGLTLEIDDVVLVVFTDLDSRQTIESIRKGRNKSENFNTDNKIFHDLNFGIIINKVIM
jgi:uncharacterized protein YjhX (UPF0386 family)